MVSKSHNKPSRIQNPYCTIKCKTKNRKKPSFFSTLKYSSAGFGGSVRSYRCNLVKFFPQLALFSYTSPHILRFRRVKYTPIKLSSQPPQMEANCLLPPISWQYKKTIFFDLDETLIHSLKEPPTKRYDFAIYPIIAGRVVPYYVTKRPGVDEILKAAAESFEVVVFTAGLKEYATLVVDQLDPSGKLIAHRLYRDSCKEVKGKFVKDLSITGRALDRSVIVDDNPDAYMYHQENALPVTKFFDDLKDRELGKLMKFFEFTTRFDDLRDAVSHYRAESGDKKSSSVSSDLVVRKNESRFQELCEIVC